MFFNTAFCLSVFAFMLAAAQALKIARMHPSPEWLESTFTFSVGLIAMISVGLIALLLWLMKGWLL